MFLRRVPLQRLAAEANLSQDDPCVTEISAMARASPATPRANDQTRVWVPCRQVPHWHLANLDGARVVAAWAGSRCSAWAFGSPARPLSRRRLEPAVGADSGPPPVRHRVSFRARLARLDPHG
jgi:hypothetical protein